MLNAIINLLKYRRIIAIGAGQSGFWSASMAKYEKSAYGVKKNDEKSKKNDVCAFVAGYAAVVGYAVNAGVCRNKYRRYVAERAD